jgi:AAA family ATP:ADP antiporter
MPVLGVLFWSKIAENSTDYSVNNTVRNMLWLPTTREMKYKAKQAVDTFFIRMGDVSSALVVFVGVELLDLGVRGFVSVNLVAIVIWLLLSVQILRAKKELPPTSQTSPAG